MRVGLVTSQRLSRMQVIPDKFLIKLNLGAVILILQFLISNKTHTMFQVYQIENTVNNKYYIGLHKGNIYSDYYYGSGKVIRQAVNKYGRKKFNREVISTFENKELAKWFEKCIVGYGVVNDRMSYNLVLGSGGYVSGEDHPYFGIKRPKRSKEWIKKLSEANSGENHCFYGKKRPNHSKIMSGDNNPMKRPEVSRKLSGKGNGMYGVPSPMKGKKRPEHAKKLSKSIIQMDLDGNEIKEWGSIKSASEYFGVSTPSICICLSGRSKTSAGYKWKYKTD